MPKSSQRQRRLKVIRVNDVVLLHPIKCLSKIINRMKYIILVFPNNIYMCYSTHITHHYKRLRIMMSNNNRGSYLLLFEAFKILQTVLIKKKLVFLPHQFTQWLSNFREVLNDTLIKSCLFKETSNSLYQDW